jgi:hypothetical protein
MLTSRSFRPVPVSDILEGCSVAQTSLEELIVIDNVTDRWQDRETKPSDGTDLLPTRIGSLTAFKSLRKLTLSSFILLGEDYTIAEGHIPDEQVSWKIERLLNSLPPSLETLFLLDCDSLALRPYISTLLEQKKQYVPRLSILSLVFVFVGAVPHQTHCISGKTFGWNMELGTFLIPLLNFRRIVELLMAYVGWR